MSSISSPTRITPARLMTLPLENEGIHLVGRYRQRLVLNLADGLLLGDVRWTPFVGQSGALFKV